MYGKKTVNSKEDIVNFLKEIEKKINEDIEWEDQFLPEKFPTVMVIVIPPTRAMYFSVFWMHVYPEDFNKPVKEIN